MTVILTALILGVVEGLTEFLPVSSTGHLIVVGHFLGFQGGAADTFDIFIQLGAILAVAVYYRAWLGQTIRAALGRVPEAPPTAAVARRSLLAILLAVLPAMVVGGVLHGAIKRYLFQPWVVSLGLVSGGIAIFAVERWRPTERIRDVSEVSLSQALLVGAGQCLSMWPGVSRSAATILSGLCLGMDHRTAAAFSFLLSIPTLTAAVAYDLFRSWHLLSGQDVLAMGIGFVVSFGVAWAVIAGFIKYLRTHSLNVFGVYRILVGLLVGWLER